MSGVFLVLAGGGIGAVLRYGLSNALRGVLGPVGELAAIAGANISGSALMGAVMAWLLAQEARGGSNGVWLFLCVGLLGGFTTFSSFSLQTVHLLRTGEQGKALLYAGGSVALAIAGLALGLALGARVWRA